MRSNVRPPKIMILFYSELQHVWSSAWNIVLMLAMPTICTLFFIFVTPRNSFISANGYVDSISSVFALSCAHILIGLLFSINLICKDKERIYLEMHDEATPITIICSKTLMIVVSCAIMSAILTFPYIMQLELEGSNFAVSLEVFWVSLLTMVVSAEIGLFVSSLPRMTSQVAPFFIPFIMLYQIMFSGVLFKESQIEEMKDLSISYYSTNLLGSVLKLEVFENNHKIVYTTQNLIENSSRLLIYFALFLLIGVVSMALKRKYKWLL